MLVEDSFAPDPTRRRAARRILAWNPLYVEGPEWLYRGGRLGRDVWNLDGEIVRLTWSWKPGNTAWLVLGGEPVHEPLRRWAAALPSTPFPTAEGAVLHRLDPALRDADFPPPR